MYYTAAVKKIHLLNFFFHFSMFWHFKKLLSINESLSFKNLDITDKDKSPLVFCYHLDALSSSQGKLYHKFSLKLSNSLKLGLPTHICIHRNL